MKYAPITPPLGSAVQRSEISRPSDALIRAVAAHVADQTVPDGMKKYLATLGGDDVTPNVLRSATRFDDTVMPMLLRAAVAPAVLTNDSWAGHLANGAVADFLIGLGPLSAGAQLLARSVPLPLAPGSAPLPIGIIPSAVPGAFVAEGDPIPLRAWAVQGAPMEPRKMAFIAAVSREMAKRSNAEALIRKVMEESAALVLDAALFSTSAASTSAPAGLLSAGTAISGYGGGDLTAMINDVTAMATIVAAVGGGDIVFVAAPGTAVRMNMLMPKDFPYPVFASSALAEGTAMAVAPRGLTFGIGAEPDITVAAEALVHMSDTPAQIVTAAGVTANPVRSMYQTAVLAIRLIADVTWLLRDARAVAYVQNAGWGLI